VLPARASWIVVSASHEEGCTMMLVGAQVCILLGFFAIVGIAIVHDLSR
jgi:hypothetical protein